MLLFRSEEHLQRWRTERNLDPGATMTVTQQWELARRWYSDRTAPDWGRKAPAEAEAVFQAIGLDGDFWRLT